MEPKRQNEIRNEIKAYIARSGWTMTNIVKKMNENQPEEEWTTTQNITNKLARGTIKYSEVLEIARIIGYEITWEPIKK
jgi:Ca2+-binding EF-hand superfamily protein